VEKMGYRFEYIPVTAETKQDAETKQLALLRDNDIDIVVLARYMQVLSESFVAHYPNRVINIHHSFLPAFAGAKPYHRAHERGVKIIGATAHYVTPDLDEGPIIDQETTRVSHRDAVADLIRTGRDLEKIVLSRAVFLHLNRRVAVFQNRTVVLT
ncbi:MAG: formyltetrahydrofolate deformylase, partial [Kiritimatiellae bacterium]|nr:formyltetrahydrofolate deformylase [Kiritimatiellia bacterium]